MHVLKSWPFEIGDSPRYSDIEKFEHLKNIPFDFVSRSIGLLVGTNVSDIIMPLETVSGSKNEPYATRHLFGWAVNGPTTLGRCRAGMCHRVGVRDTSTIEANFSRMYAQDFDDSQPQKKGQSFEDRLWLERVNNSIRKLPDNHSKIALPFRNTEVNMPCNFRQAIDCLLGLKKRLLGNDKLHSDYKDFM